VQLGAPEQSALLIIELTTVSTCAVLSVFPLLFMSWALIEISISDADATGAGLTVTFFRAVTTAPRLSYIEATPVTLKPVDETPAGRVEVQSKPDINLVKQPHVHDSDVELNNVDVWEK
jgi:hypothetical protein